MPRSLAALTLAVASAWSSPVAAASGVSVAPSAQRHGLAVAQDDARGGILAKACRGRCTAAGGTFFAFPDDVDATRASLEIVALAPGREVVLAEVPVRDGEGRWVLVLAPPRKGEPLEVVKTLRGHVGQPKGKLDGERKTKVLRRSKGPRGDRLVLGTQYENATLCGHDALLQVTELDPDTLRWIPRAADALDEATKRSATPLQAERGGAFVADEPRLLAGRVASSAKGRSALHATDRDLSTRWAEARPGDGAGEFLVTSATPAVPVEGIEVVLRGGAEDEVAAAPKRFYLVTPQKTFAVSLPEDAMEQPAGTTYRVALPAAVATSCVGVVLDEGHVDDERTDVGFVEVRARTAYDGMSPLELAAALTGPRAEGAKALLSRGGDAAVKAVIAGFDRLEPGARIAALEVIDSGSCRSTAPFFVELLLGQHARDPRFDPALDREAAHGREQLLGCRSAAVDALVRAMKDAGVTQQRSWAARELVDVDPVGAIEPLLALLPEGSKAPAGPGTDDEVRRGLRAALAIALRHRRSQEALATLLREGFSERPLVTRIDILRAAGPALLTQPDADRALASLLEGEPTFRTRYLLAPPAALLAAQGSPAATGLLRQALADENPHLRGHAIALVGGVRSLAPRAIEALDDPHARVRRAALEALLTSGATSSAIEAKVVRLLRDDPWTFVRTRAARALTGMPPSPASNAALRAAAESPRRPVVIAALEAMGERGQRDAGPFIEDMADNPKLAVPVRTAAIHALGALCRTDAADLLTKLALRAGVQQLPYDQPLGLASLSALGRIKPADLEERLAPLLALNARIPRTVRQLARDALRRPSSCR